MTNKHIKYKQQQSGLQINILKETSKHMLYTRQNNLIKITSLIRSPVLVSCGAAGERDLKEPHNGPHVSDPMT